MDGKYRIAILASGSGTNAENIIKYFGERKDVAVTGIYCNKKEAGVFCRAEKLDVRCSYFNKDSFMAIADKLQADGVDLVVLAGFLLKIPAPFIDRFRNRIINIHPALLPKYGGKGMYGDHVHRAVLAAGDAKSGITIHLVDEVYDNGEILFQAKCDVQKGDTVESIAKKIHALEYQHFPVVIEGYLKRPDYLR